MVVFFSSLEVCFEKHATIEHGLTSAFWWVEQLSSNPGQHLALLLVLVAPMVAIQWWGRRSDKRFKAQQRRQTMNWQLLTQTGDAGPAEPREGFKVLVAEKHQSLLEDGETVQTRFQLAEYGWGWDHWQRLRPLALEEYDHIAGIDALQKVFTGNVDTDEAADAWFDFQKVVEAENRRRWQVTVAAEIAQQQKQTLEAQHEAARREGIAAQAALADVLDGPTVRDDQLKVARARR